MQALMPRTLLRAKRRAKVCPETHKQGYRTKGKALKFAERSKQITGLRLFVYECRSCRRWHMTSQAPRAKGTA